jgi:pyruvate dehydrogenase E2 component (dihydrolipoamide acetyltransferase)
MSETIVMPKLGMTMTEGTITEWYKDVGDPVEKGEAILTISSEKLNQDIESPIAGVLLTKNGEVEDELKVGAAIGVIGVQGETVLKGDMEANQSVAIEVAALEKPISVASSAVVESTEKQNTTAERIFITPLARKMAQRENVDIDLITGTGGNGRITKLDIQRVVANRLDYKSDTPSESATQATSVDLTTVGEGLTPMRKAIARNMRGSLGQTAQLTLHRKANVDNLIDFQKVVRKEIESNDLDIKLTVTVLIAKATVLALQELKKMNSVYHDGQLTEFDEVHLGIATSLEEGLLVPVIKDAHQKTIGSLAKEIKEVTGKARNGEAGGDLLSGSTFTITNLGASGIEYFTPILNTPETGILGLGSFQDELILTDEEKVKLVRKIPLSLTFDHQIVDGATAAEFLEILVSYIESPYLLVL